MVALVTLVTLVTLMGRFDAESLFSQESAGDQTATATMASRSASMASGCSASDEAGSASMASGRIEGDIVRVFVIRHDQQRHGAQRPKRPKRPRRPSHRY
mmetsp:Transcript_2525/g.4661  ORF Transcript_2525/g.4661 Transcript_2525/m.4661 type:complete len:100 (+) Transcript_2525:79-378(+)